jgi:hypothetical protein
VMHMFYQHRQRDFKFDILHGLIWSLEMESLNGLGCRSLVRGSPTIECCNELQVVTPAIVGDEFQTGNPRQVWAC